MMGENGLGQGTAILIFSAQLAALTDHSRHAFMKRWKGSHINFSECNCKHLVYLKITLGQ
jgi:hypothetical protein